MRSLLVLSPSLLALAVVAFAACNPAEEGPTKCDNYTTPVLAQDPSGQPIAAPESGIIDKPTCNQACDGSTCSIALVDGGTFITCLEDAGVDCYR